MKTVTIFAGILLALAACKKNQGIAPHKSELSGVEVQHDTIPDKAAFKIKLFADSVNYDETAVLFNHSAGTTFNPDRDGSYLPGFGEVSLASISSDGKDLAIYQLPYRPGMSIGLNVQTKKEGSFGLKLSYEHKIPAGIRIWLVDTYAKDSVNLCLGGYGFTINKPDSNSFGRKRFRLILKDEQEQQ